MKEKSNDKIHSEHIDDIFVPFTSIINIVTRLKKTDKSFFITDQHGTVYLPFVHVNELHEILVEMYRESEDPVNTGYVQKSNLEYALDHIRQVHNAVLDKKARLLNKAAFLMHNIAIGHPFVDGNKRTAIVATNSFLEWNGYTIGHLPWRESKKFITEIADVENFNKTEKDCKEFIERHITEFQLSKENEDKLMEKIKDILKK